MNTERVLMNYAKIKIKSILQVFILSQILFAHPHMFVDVSQHFKLNENGLEGFQMVWTVDEMNSLQIVEAYDSNANNQIDSAETSAMEAMLLPLIKRVVSVQVNGTPLQNCVIENFQAGTSEDDLLQYTFFIEFPVNEYGEQETSIATTVYDDLLFVAFDMLSDSITSENPNGIICSTSVSETKNRDSSLLSIKKEI